MHAQAKYDSQKVRYAPKPTQRYKEPKVEKPPAPDPVQHQTMKAQNPTSTLPPHSYNTSIAPSGAVYYEDTDNIDTDLYECGDFNEDDYEVAT